MNINTNELNFKKGDGLITAIVQDENSGTVLMVGYQNILAVEKTIQDKKITFWSRTKKRLWKKGEESGNYLVVKDAKIDCDQDAILYSVIAPDCTCHTKKFSCFGEKDHFNFLSELSEKISSRKKLLPKDSYLTELFSEGLDRIAQKVGEEAVEVVIASKNKDRDDFIGESADLIFHLLVLCSEKNIDFQEVLKCLKKRS